LTFLPLVRIEGVRGSNPLSSTEFFRVSLLAVIGRIPLKDLTVQDVRGALKEDGGDAFDPDVAEGP